MDRKIVKLRGNYRNLNSGEIAGFPVKEADALIRDGLAFEVDEEGGPIQPAASPTAEGSGDGAGGDGDGGKNDEPDISSMSKEELVALADEREVTVTRADGEEGEPLKADYIRALTEAGEAADDDDTSDEPSS